MPEEMYLTSALAMGVSGSGFRVEGFRFRVSGLGLKGWPIQQSSRLKLYRGYGRAYLTR